MGACFLLKVLPGGIPLAYCPSVELLGTYSFKDIKKNNGTDNKKLLNERMKSVQMDDPGCILFTSGTTGLPKGAVLTHFQMLNQGIMSCKVLGFFEKKPIICVQVPLFHIFGLSGGTLLTLLCNGTAVYPSGHFHAPSSLKSIEEERCTMVYGTPTMFVDMLIHISKGNYDLNSWKEVIVGAAPVHENLINVLRDKCKVKIYNVYGSTEISGMVSIDSKMKFPSAGRIFEYTEIKIVDTDGRIVPINTKGEILCRSPFVCSGYWDEKEKTAETFDNARWYHTGTLIIVIVGAAPVHENLINVLRDKCKVKIYNVYGSTEISGMVSIDSKMKFPSAGRIFEYTEIKIVDTDGRIVPINTKGEILCRSPFVCSGYWDEKEKTAETFDNARWYHTGDVGVLDENGCVIITGRIKDMVIRGGENIYPQEIENFLLSHPAISEVYVIGVPDSRLGEELCACIQLKQGHKLTGEDVKEFCKEKTTGGEYFQKSQLPVVCKVQTQLTIDRDFNEIIMIENQLSKSLLDVGVLDENGCLIITGRIKDMVIRGGENIYPQEIENFLLSHPAISEVYVIGVPDSRLGEELCACIQLKQGHKLTGEDVKEFCKEKISYFKIPRYVLFFEEYPKTESGKIQKYILQKECIKILKL
ncbi:acyl-CoA synthetase family member 2, mitochondrial-like [Centruroides sculpturatus]|uniref:acyl-CoA synthetase family member 2, mitochondrial-like n=1 Tax=Centruroides sculpturatus TaxID=218467 RepID=UPI000C6E80D2|nr:acyl-CoA synthetase family member 2, mitochondrial-like [Centruroides sculpturatus]